MFNNCDCENVDKCSIMGYMPAGFECPYFKAANSDSQFNAGESSLVTATEEVVGTTLKNGILEVVIEKEGKKVPVKIDIHQVLDA